MVRRPLAEIVNKATRSNSRVYDINPYRYAKLVDREGSIWIGDPTGVHRFSYSPLIQPDIPETQGPHFTIAADEGGVVWITAGNRTVHPPSIVWPAESRGPYRQGD